MNILETVKYTRVLSIINLRPYEADILTWPTSNNHQHITEENIPRKKGTPYFPAIAQFPPTITWPRWRTCKHTGQSDKMAGWPLFSTCLPTWTWSMIQVRLTVMMDTDLLCQSSKTKKECKQLSHTTAFQCPFSFNICATDHLHTEALCGQYFWARLLSH